MFPTTKEVISVKRWGIQSVEDWNQFCHFVIVQLCN